MTLEELYHHIGRRLEQDKRLAAMPVVAAHHQWGEAHEVLTNPLGVHTDDGCAVLTFQTRTDQ